MQNNLDQLSILTMNKSNLLLTVRLFIPKQLIVLRNEYSNLEDNILILKLQNID